MAKKKQSRDKSKSPRSTSQSRRRSSKPNKLVEPGSDDFQFDLDASVAGEDAPTLPKRERHTGELEYPDCMQHWECQTPHHSTTPHDEFNAPSTDELAFGETEKAQFTRMRILQQFVVAEPERVFDPDDRVFVRSTVDPERRWARQICSLIVRTRTGRTARGTGFFVGPRTIVTAGHNLFFHNERGWALSVRVVPGRNGTQAPFGEFTVTGRDLFSTEGWVDHRSLASDYGAIRVPVDYADRFGSQVGFFGLRVMNDTELKSKRTNIAGYPSDKLPTGSLWWHGRRVIRASNRTFNYDTDTSEGQSGSPVWVLLDGKRYVVGVHNYDIGHFNQATRVTSGVLNTIRRWKV